MKILTEILCICVGLCMGIEEGIRYLVLQCKRNKRIIPLAIIDIVLIPVKLPILCILYVCNKKVRIWAIKEGLEIRSEIEESKES